MMKPKSIVTKYTDICFSCNRPCSTEHHLLFGNGMRALADKDRVTLPACDQCHVTGELLRRIHDNPMAEKLSRIAGQLAWEKHCIAQSGCSEDEARERFRQRYRESFL